ncbi:hypothetical protein HPG69_007493 [Diceros bicornis minor]|uniref:E3 ubiquitin-protein ligase CHFR n=1 Tax=Diceros bicornis minor TaxID=77932 RepID=A0A7J7F725_DICBM|nr:hypothetical protein HPG69_007493 [Diceros bicornis minor]
MERPGEGEQPPQQQPWGRLLRLGAEEGEPHVLLRKREWTIGRRRGCDLSFPGNKLVSGDHCKIIVDEKSGQVSLEDTSTNGTVINKLKVVKKQTCPLQTGDVIYLVYRKNEPEHNVAYLYESLNEKQSITQDSLEANKENVFHMTKDTSGAGQGDDPQVLPSPTTQACFEEPQPSTSMSALFPTASTSSTEPTSAGRAPPSVSGSGDAGVSPKGYGPSMASDEISSLPSVFPDREGASFSLLESQDQEDLEPIKKRMKGDGEPDPNLQLLVVGQCRDTHAALEDVSAVAMKPDKMEETLTCIICQDLLHDCVRYTRCSAGSWRGASRVTCPVEGLWALEEEAQVKQASGSYKSRSEEDVRSMAARNKITQDMLQPKVRRSFSDEEGSSEDLLELSDVDSESSDVSQPYVVCRQCPEYRRQAGQPLPCPGPGGEPGAPQALGDTPSTSASVTTAQDYVCALQGSHAICTCCFQPMPDRRAEREQNPRIAPQQCAVCLQPFCHLYWGCARTGCLGCLAPFCELNLGDRCLDGVLSNNSYESDILKVCTKGAKQLRVSEGQSSSPDPRLPCHVAMGLLLHCGRCGQASISSIAFVSPSQNYLATRGLTWKNMLTESLVALQRGVFLLSGELHCTCFPPLGWWPCLSCRAGNMRLPDDCLCPCVLLPDYRITGNTVLCYCCGLRSFRELTYQYRQNIPASELPVAVTSRPDCYWGRNCRTQVKAHHAM